MSAIVVIQCNNCGTDVRGYPREAAHSIRFRAKRAGWARARIRARDPQTFIKDQDGPCDLCRECGKTCIVTRSKT